MTMFRMSVPIIGRWFGFVIVGTVAAAFPCRADDSSQGAAIYRLKCASCHGNSGEGTVQHPEPLAGVLSVLQLEKVIDETMPEDDPSACVGEDARKVATYIHETFYSPVARDRIRPARIDLTRLTVRQYRNCVADLVGSFRSDVPTLDRRHGLDAEYFNGRNFDGNKRVIQRIDPVVSMNFGTAAPAPEGFQSHRFAIRWRGSVIPRETGVHEFIVHTEHSVRLFVNDHQTAFIDAYVKSGDDKEFRGSIYLLGGRAYPLLLEFSKANQGVDNEKQEKPEVPASIKLQWKPPGGVEEIVPSRCLTPTSVPEVFVSTAAFPPDDRSIGYERGTDVSKEWLRGATDAAIETAGYVVERIDLLANTKPDDEKREEKIRQFVVRWAETAWRRPLSQAEQSWLLSIAFAQGRNTAEAVKWSVLMVLQSPRFLYQHLVQSPGLEAHPFETASRLSLGLWDSLPDKQLIEAAKNNQLLTSEHITAQARRMLKDQKAKQKIRTFFMAWLRVDGIPELFKDPDKYPEFSPEIASDLRASLDAFVEEIFWSEASDFRQLFTATSIPLNGRLAPLYGAVLPADADFQNIEIDPMLRSGLLSHPYLMSVLSYRNVSSPIHRGVFVVRSILGRVLRPPPDAVAPLSPDLHPSLTTRQRVSLQTSASACQICHSTINPFGFALENFDAIGRLRTEEKAMPIDAVGEYQPPMGERVHFSGARELGKYLVASSFVQEAFIERLFHALVQQPIRAFGADALQQLRLSFEANGFHMQKLVVEIMVQEALGKTPSGESLQKNKENKPEIPSLPLFTGPAIKP